MALAPAIAPAAPPTGNGPPRGPIAKSFGGNKPWLNVAFGICAAGAVYPMLIVGLYALIGLVFVSMQLVRQPPQSIGFQLFSAMPFIMMIALWALAAACVGAIWTGFISMFVVPVFYLFVKSMHLRASIVWLGAICGGIVAFVAVLPFLLHGPGADDWLIISIVGPGLATVVGQLGGTWGGMKSATAPPQPNADADAIEPEKEPLVRFQIRHLMWLTVWIALLLTVIRLAGIPFEFIVPALLGWLVYATATLYCGWLIARRFGPWWQGRRYLKHPHAAHLPKGEGSESRST